MLYIKETFGVETELIMGTAKDNSDAQYDRFAYTIMPYYNMSTKATSFLRYEYVDANTNKSATKYNGSVKVWLPGVNYQLASDDDSVLVWKTEVRFVDADAKTYYASKAGKNSEGVQFSELRMSMAIAF
jgi:hypothetical protein